MIIILCIFVSIMYRNSEEAICNAWKGSLFRQFFQLIGNFLYGHHIRLLRISCIASAGYDKKYYHLLESNMIITPMLRPALYHKLTDLCNL